MYEDMTAVKRVLTCLLALTIYNGCKRQETTIGSKEIYFDLKGYFTKEAHRMDSLKPEIRKIVEKNNESETLQLRVSGWKNELTLFSESDINKPAWADSYRIDSAGRILEYQARSSDLRTRNIRIERGENNTITGIYIKNTARNLLYESEEDLFYIPDSVYRVEKTQTVRFIGTNHYRITGSVVQQP